MNKLIGEGTHTSKIPRSSMTLSRFSSHEACQPSTPSWMYLSGLHAGDQQVVEAGGRVGLEAQDRSATIGHEVLAYGGKQLSEGGARVLR